jgi:hypothetical protein
VVEVIEEEVGEELLSGAELATRSSIVARSSLRGQQSGGTSRGGCRL